MGLAIGLAWLVPVVTGVGDGRVAAVPPAGIPEAAPGEPPGDADAVPSEMSESPEPVPVSGSASDFLTPVTGTFAVLAVIGVAVIIRRRLWRLGDAPVRARTFSSEWSLIFGGGMLVGSLVVGSLVVALMGAFGGGTPDLSTLGGTLRLTLPIYAIQAAAVCAWWAGRRVSPRPDAPAIPPARLGRAVAAGLGGLLIAWPLVVVTTTGVALLVVLGGGEPPAAIAHETLDRIATDPWQPAALATIALVTLVVPWIEEAVYRGMLLGGLVAAGIGRHVAIVIVAAVFALRHLGIAEPHAVAGLFVLGLALGLAVERTGRLTAAVVMHAAFNVGNIVLAVAGSGQG